MGVGSEKSRCGLVLSNSILCLSSSFSLRQAEYTVRNLETTMALFRANTPSKEIYTWLYPQDYYKIRINYNYNTPLACSVF